MSKKPKRKQKKKSSRKKSSKASKPVKKTARKAAKKALKKTKSRPGTLIQSPKGSHLFDNAVIGHAYFLELEEIRARQRITNKCEDVLGCLDNFYANGDWQKEQEPGSAYRYIFDGRGPLDPAATFGAGGRVNPGMAQMIQNMQEIQAVSGIYASLQEETAKAEFESGGIPVGQYAKLYELQFSGSSIKIVDYDLVAQEFDASYPEVGLLNEISNMPTNACWAYLKYPQVSQILGHWIHSNFPEVDLITFSSTKKAGGTNCFITHPESWDYSLVS